MSEEPRIIDGADRRKKRLLDMLAFIDNEKTGATSQEIKTFMLCKFGLKNKTCAEYIQECHLAGLVKLDGVKWTTTHTFKRLASMLY